MKVVKKVKLLMKDSKGSFIKNNNYTVLRTRAVIQESSVKQSESTYKETGILYIVDEEATNKFLKVKSPVVVPNEKSELQAEYEQLMGDKPNGTWGIKKLTEEINSIKNENK